MNAGCIFRMTSMISVCLLLIGCAMVWCAMVVPLHAEDSHTPLEPITCPGERNTGDDAVCFILHVPSDWGDLSNRPMELPVMRFAPLGAQATKPPILVLAGGPGQSVIRLEKLIADNLKPFRQDRELILMDQRGTGPFASQVECQEAIGEGESIDIDTIARCVREAEDQAHYLSDYRTSFAVQDYRALRYALKIDQWAVMASSYGARVAQGLIEVDNEGIERLIFNGPLFIGTRFFDWKPSEQVEAALELCNEDDQCRAQNPNLYWDYQRLDFAIRAVRLPKDSLIQEIQPFLYKSRLQALLARHQLGQVPADITSTAQSLKDALEQDAVWTPPSPLRQSMKGIGLLMHFAILCAEDITPFAGTDLSELDQPLQMAFYRAVCDRIAMETVRVIKLDAGWDEGKSTKKPVLILNGAMDTIVDPTAAGAALALFPNGRWLSFPYLGHDLLSNIPCARTIVAEFLNGVEVSKIDAGCVERIRPLFEPAIAPERKPEGKPQG